MSLDSILRATGKNLANCGEKSDWYSPISVLTNLTVSDGVVSLPAVSAGSGMAINKNRVFTNGESFTIHANHTSPTGDIPANQYRYILKPYKNNTVVKDITITGWTYNQYYNAYWASGTSKSFTLPKDTVNSFEWGLGFLAHGDISAGTVITYSNIQIEKGSTATTYEPYEYLGPKTINLGRKSKNLIFYPYTETTKTQKGITFTDNGDGTITVNGTSTGLATFTLGSVSLDNTKSYFLSGKNTSSNLPLRIQIGQTWRAEEGNGLAISQAGGNHCTITLGALKGFTFDNVIIYPQLEEGSVATDYELNTGSKEVLKVSYNSRNLIPYPYFSNTITNNGVTYTVNANGSIKVSGTASADNNSVFFIRSNTLPLTLRQGEQYTLSGHIEDSGITFSMQDSSFKQTISVTNTITSKSFTTLYSNYYMWLVVLKGTTVDTVVYPQLEMGNKATDYVPYFNTTVWTKKA